MVRWYHAIFSAYGFWLPNDPRGSWSDFVHSYELYRFGGPATTVGGKRSYAHDPHDVRFRREAKEHLKYPPARFDEPCRVSIANGFARAVEEAEITVFACAIGFDHVHIVTARHRDKSIEDVVRHLKSRATKAMNTERCHPMARYSSRAATPTPWGVGCWSVFIDDVTQLRNAIGYVERHPTKEGLSEQHWSFVQSVDRPV